MTALRQFSLFIIILLLLNSCGMFKMHKRLTSQKVVRDGRSMLYGKITREQLYFDYPGWKTVEERYEPQKELIEKLKKIKTKTTVKIFMATWCPDSKREVPHFFKIVRQAQLQPVLKIEMWAVDRKKNAPHNAAKAFNIQYVPTFIFMRNGKEIGRIVERPRSEYLEKDMYLILSGKHV